MLNAAAVLQPAAINIKPLFGICRGLLILSNYGIANGIPLCYTTEVIR